MWEADRLNTQDRYRRRFREYGHDPRTLGWNKDCQWVRFRAALEGLREDEFASVLDVGCGFGDLLGYLRQRGWSGHYTGVDLLQEFTDDARHRYGADERAEFACGDLHDLVHHVKSDLVIAIGIFNHRLQQDNFDFVRSTVAAMWTAASKVTVCDFLSVSSEPERRQPHLYYVDPCEIYALASSYSRRVMIHHAYMPFEFQVKIWRDDSFVPETPVFKPFSRLASRQSLD